METFYSIRIENVIFPLKIPVSYSVRLKKKNLQRHPHEENSGNLF